MDLSFILVGNMAELETQLLLYECIVLLMLRNSLLKVPDPSGSTLELVLLLLHFLEQAIVTQ